MDASFLPPSPSRSRTLLPQISSPAMLAPSSLMLAPRLPRISSPAMLGPSSLMLASRLPRLSSPAMLAPPALCRAEITAPTAKARAPGAKAVVRSRPAAEKVTKAAGVKRKRIQAPPSSSHSILERDAPAMPFNGVAHPASEVFDEMAGRIMAEAKTKKGSRVYLRWTPEMDTALLAMLVEHHKRGDHVQNGWKPHVYNACIKHVKETRDLVINNDKIIARIKTFDKQYDIIIKMLAQSGFGWDWENNMVRVESDEVWLRYVEANKDATFYRNKEVKN
ncbi:hypothetical protein D1007_15886 [Hordeum vulgare]|nr:hypothetical protein D1007_15886 [Hordeum vulgare]